MKTKTIFLFLLLCGIAFTNKSAAPAFERAQRDRIGALLARSAEDLAKSILVFKREKTQIEITVLPQATESMRIDQAQVTAQDVKGVWTSIKSIRLRDGTPTFYTLTTLTIIMDEFIPLITEIFAKIIEIPNEISAEMARSFVSLIALAITRPL